MKPNLNIYLLGLAMLLAAGLALALAPHSRVADQRAKFELEDIVPMQFGSWKADETIVPLMVSPEQKQVLEETYNQTLSRTYVNRNGKRIMLSIAYGGNHGEGMQTHRPEICYPAQGFQVVKNSRPILLDTPYGGIEAVQLSAQYGARHEPITYWVVVGDQQTQFGLRMKLAQMRYNLTGVVPDGMLVRVSSIDNDEEGAYAYQRDFILAMLSALRESERAHLTGKLGA